MTCLSTNMLIYSTNCFNLLPERMIQVWKYLNSYIILKGVIIPKPLLWDLELRLESTSMVGQWWRVSRGACKWLCASSVVVGSETVVLVCERRYQCGRGLRAAVCNRQRRCVIARGNEWSECFVSGEREKLDENSKSKGEGEVKLGFPSYNIYKRYFCNLINVGIRGGRISTLLKFS